MTESERCRNFYKLKTVCAMLRYGAVVKSRLGHTPQRLLIMAEKVPCVHRVGTKHDVCTDCCMKMTVSTIPEKNVDVSDLLVRRGDKDSCVVQPFSTCPLIPVQISRQKRKPPHCSQHDQRSSFKTTLFNTLHQENKQAAFFG